MLTMRTIGGRAFKLVLMVSFVTFSVMSSMYHAPSVSDEIEAHLAMTTEHGHSHGLEEDLLRAMHGHSHDVYDHDHSTVWLALSSSTLGVDRRDSWQPAVSEQKSSLTFLIERPPRA